MAHYTEAVLHAGRATGHGIEAAEALAEIEGGMLRACPPVRALMA